MTNSNQKVTHSLYPFKFQSILKPVLWGGSEISHFKGIEPVQEGIGESWEISGVKNNLSVVANGPLAGTTLEELIAEDKDTLVGKLLCDIGIAERAFFGAAIKGGLLRYRLYPFFAGFHRVILHRCFIHSALSNPP